MASEGEAPSEESNVVTPSVSKSTVLGVEQAKKRLQALYIQQKHTASATLAAGSSTEKSKSAPKKSNKKELSEYDKLREGYQELKKIREENERKLALVKLGIPLGLVPGMAGLNPTMPTKAMPPIKNLLDPEKVEQLLNQAASGNVDFDIKSLLEKSDNKPANSDFYSSKSRDCDNKSKHKHDRKDSFSYKRRSRNEKFDHNEKSDRHDKSRSNRNEKSDRGNTSDRNFSIKSDRKYEKSRSHSSKNRDWDNSRKTYRDYGGHRDYQRNRDVHHRDYRRHHNSHSSSRYNDRYKEKPSKVDSHSTELKEKKKNSILLKPDIRAKVAEYVISSTYTPALKNDVPENPTSKNKLPVALSFLEDEGDEVLENSPSQKDTNLSNEEQQISIRDQSFIEEKFLKNSFTLVTEQEKTTPKSYNGETSDDTNDKYEALPIFKETDNSPKLNVDISYTPSIASSSYMNSPHKFNKNVDKKEELCDSAFGGEEFSKFSLESENKSQNSIDNSIWNDISQMTVAKLHCSENCYRNTVQEPIISYCENLNNCNCPNVKAKFTEKLSLNAYKIKDQFKSPEICDDNSDSKNVWYPKSNDVFKASSAESLSNWESDDSMVPDVSNVKRSLELAAVNLDQSDAKSLPAEVITSSNFNIDSNISLSENVKKIEQSSDVEKQSVSSTNKNTSLLDSEYEKFMEAVCTEMCNELSNENKESSNFSAEFQDTTLSNEIPEENVTQLSPLASKIENNTDSDDISKFINPDKCESPIENKETVENKIEMSYNSDNGQWSAESDIEIKPRKEHKSIIHSSPKIETKRKGHAKISSRRKKGKHENKINSNEAFSASSSSSLSGKSSASNSLKSSSSSSESTSTIDSSLSSTWSTSSNSDSSSAITLSGVNSSDSDSTKKKLKRKKHHKFSKSKLKKLKLIEKAKKLAREMKLKKKKKKLKAKLSKEKVDDIDLQDISLLLKQKQKRKSKDDLNLSSKHKKAKYSSDDDDDGSSLSTFGSESETKSLKRKKEPDFDTVNAEKTKKIKTAASEQNSESFDKNEEKISDEEHVFHNTSTRPNRPIINANELHSDFLLGNSNAVRTELSDEIYAPLDEISHKEDAISDISEYQNESKEDRSYYSENEFDDDDNLSTSQNASLTEETVQMPIEKIEPNWRSNSNNAYRGKKTRWDYMIEDEISIMHINNSSLIEVPIKSELDMSSNNMIVDSSIDVSHTNDDEVVYKIQTVSSRSTEEFKQTYENDHDDYDINYEAYSKHEIEQETFNEVKYSSMRKISLDDRINMVLRHPGESCSNHVDTQPLQNLDISPEKGILVANNARVSRIDPRLNRAKNVHFADGFLPGQDSDCENESNRSLVYANGIGKKKKQKSFGGHAYPCPEDWPDYHPKYDKLPPPPPPPGSPPPDLYEKYERLPLMNSNSNSNHHLIPKTIVPNLVES